MKKFLNTLFVTSEDVYLSLDGENVVATRDKEKLQRYPLHTLQLIISFSYSGASPALMGACAKREIGFVFCTKNGRFLARISGISHGNVLLRRKQYRLADDESKSIIIARNMITGKLFNSRWVLERALRDHPLRINENELHDAIEIIKNQTNLVSFVESMDSLQGYEGVSAVAYFGVFNQLILRNKDDFYFHSRTRRPPLDKVNAMLSFAYSMLSAECASALESVGLDSYVGFMHRDKPGRQSLALDLMEEMRSVVADRFVLTLINNRLIKPSCFSTEESGAVLLNDEGRRIFLKAWQDRKREIITHPFLKEKIPWGLLPYVQALLLSRYLRGDLDGYPPFFWK